MSDEEEVEEKAKPAIFNTKVFGAITKAINENSERLNDLGRLLLTLENACGAMYEFIMAEKKRSDELEKRIDKLEKNP